MHEGRLIEFPNAQHDIRTGVQSAKGKRKANIVGTVIVTKDCAEELNKLSIELRVVEG
jgi:hypothetical protein